jgi:hypothetical protein
MTSLSQKARSPLHKILASNQKLPYQSLMFLIPSKYQANEGDAYASKNKQLKLRGNEKSRQT